VQKNFFLAQSFRRAQKLVVAVVFDDDESGKKKAGKSGKSGKVGDGRCTMGNLTTFFGQNPFFKSR